MELIDAKKICALLQAAWPNYAWRKESANAYLLGLGDLPYDLVEQAVGIAIRTRTFCPVPAELRSIALEAVTAHVPTVDQAWSEVSQQLVRVWPHQTPEFSHPLIAQAVRIIGWRQISESEKPGVERAHFFEIYDALRKREVHQITLDPLGAGGPEVKQIDAYRERKNS